MSPVRSEQVFDVVESMLQRGIASESNGAVVIFLSESTEAAEDRQAVALPNPGQARVIGEFLVQVVADLQSEPQMYERLFTRCAFQQCGRSAHAGQRL